MKTKNIIAGFGLIAFIVLFFYTKLSGQEFKPKNWKPYVDQNIGVSFEYPDSVKPNYPKSVTFSECNQCPFLLSVRAEEIGDMGIDEAYRVFRSSEKQIGQIKIDGERAFETTPTDEGRVIGNNRVYYVVHDGYLYKIYDRLHVDQKERNAFLKSFKFEAIQKDESEINGNY